MVHTSEKDKLCLPRNDIKMLVQNDGHFQVLSHGRKTQAPQKRPSGHPGHKSEKQSNRKKQAENQQQPTRQKNSERK